MPLWGRDEVVIRTFSPRGTTDCEHRCGHNRAVITVICGCVYLWVCDAWVCVCVGCEMRGCVYVWVLCMCGCVMRGCVFVWVGKCVGVCMCGCCVFF